MLKIKQIRNEKNISQQELAAITGLSKRMIIDYEKENTDIPLKKLQLIASAMQVNFLDLIDNKKDIIYEENDTNLSFKESKESYNRELYLSIAQQKTIDILEREVNDLRSDKELLKKIIEMKLH